jgi:phosphate-selective porin
MEEATSSTDIITVERSYVANFFAGGKPVGAWAEGEAGPVGLFLGAFNGEETNDNPLDSDGDSHFAYNFRAGFDASEYLPEDISAGVFFDTVQNQDNNSDEAYQFQDSYSLGAEVEVGAFGIMGNFLWGQLTEDDADITGFVVMPWFYVTPKLQIVGQYDYLDSNTSSTIGVQSRYLGRTAIDDDKGDSSADKGDNWQSWYLGANYYISGNNLKVMGGLAYSTLENEGSEQVDAVTVYGALRMRF